MKKNAVIVIIHNKLLFLCYNIVGDSMNGRYSLMVRDLDTSSVITIKLPTLIIDEKGTKNYNNEDAKTKATLPYIDSITQKYTKEGLVNALNNAHYINSFNVDIFISYRHDDAIHYVEALFKNDPAFYRLTDNFNSNIKLDNDLFTKTCLVWYDKLKSEKFRNFIKKSNKINNHIKDNINNKYRIDNVNDHFYEKKIKEDLSSFKTLRDIYELYKEYKDSNYLTETNNNVKERNDIFNSIEEQEDNKINKIEDKITKYQETKEYLMNNLNNGTLIDEDELWVHKDLDDIINESGVKK